MSIPAIPKCKRFAAKAPWACDSEIASYPLY